MTSAAYSGQVRGSLFLPSMSVTPSGGWVNTLSMDWASSVRSQFDSAVKQEIKVRRICKIVNRRWKLWKYAIFQVSCDYRSMEWHIVSNDWTSDIRVCDNHVPHCSFILLGITVNFNIIYFIQLQDIENSFLLVLTTNSRLCEAVGLDYPTPKSSNCPFTFKI